MEVEDTPPRFDSGRIILMTLFEKPYCFTRNFFLNSVGIEPLVNNTNLISCLFKKNFISEGINQETLFCLRAFSSLKILFE